MNRRRLISAAAALVLLLVAGPPEAPRSDEQAASRTLEIHPAVRLVVNERGDLFFEVKAAPGDGWSQLARRFATSPDDWRAIRSINGGGEPARDRYYRVPYALLSDSFKFLGIAALFPEDVLEDEGWVHRVGTARLPIEEESLYRIAFWLTGDGENFRAILRASGRQDLSLQPGQEIVIPTGLLLDAFRRRSEAATDTPLDYARDDEGEVAVYRLRRGEALYSDVIARFTGRVDPQDVDEALARIASRSGIRDVTGIPAGFPVKIPVDLLSERFLPPGDPRRVALEMNRLLASQYQTSVRSADLEGIVVVLDPGHGGVDIGTHQNGVWEDDVVYDIAVRLQRLLRQRTAATVHMTLRDRSQKDKPYDQRFKRIDRDEIILSHPTHAPTSPAARAVGVNLRAFIASSLYRGHVGNGADDEKIVFLSIHADALHRSVRGAMIYVPGERFRRGRYGASGSTYGRYREVREQPYVSFSRSERLRSEGLSRQFADAILESFRAHDLAIHPAEPVRDHIVRRGRSWVPAVLRGNEIPIKVLLEVANIANTTDASLLAAPAHRERVAEALLDALLAFYRVP